MLALEYISKERTIAADQSTTDILKKGYFGKLDHNELVLSPEEVLYLIDVRNAECISKGKKLNFNDLSSKFWRARKFAARYFTYKDWRDRGLIIKDPAFGYTGQSSAPSKGYPKSAMVLPDYKIHGIFFEADLLTIVDDMEKGREIYDNLWFGQYGSYKAAERGKLNKLDMYETLFLLEKGILALDNSDRKRLVTLAKSRRKDFLELYDVYQDWREKGYVVKTGFKFGTHFRIYFPGARPANGEGDERFHSKHVIHVFPKESKLLISEWARAIRVAHSVRKTFILAVPGKTKDRNVAIDYILYHRRSGDAENPGNANPRYAMLSLSEDEYIGGNEFANAIKEAKSKKLELIVAIADRETAVTYYKVRQISLPGSRNEYYEIDWLQP